MNVTFKISEEALDLGIRCICFLIENVKIQRSSQQLQLEKQRVLSEIITSLTPQSIQSDPVLNGFRLLHEKVGRSNKKYPASPEKMLESLLHNRTLSDINTFVDIYNLVSVKSRLSLGAHDVRFIDGGVEMRITDGTESFHPLGSAPKAVKAGDYAYIDDSKEVLCLLDVRQCEKTKVTEETTECFVIVQGNTCTDKHYLQDAADELISMLKKHCGGLETMLYTPF